MDGSDGEYSACSSSGQLCLDFFLLCRWIFIFVSVYTDPGTDTAPGC